MNTPQASHSHTNLQAVRLPAPRTAISIRVALMDDLPFIDALQKMHSHMVGWMPRKQLEGYLEGEHVLIAEGIDHGGHGGHGEEKTGFENSDVGDSHAHSESSSVSPVNPVPPVVNTPLGYCIGKDQYLKRDDVGIVYQLNVLPLKQRNLIGATLVKATFDRAAYGCKLFCCWCAQDIQANWFWESIGFVPLAFRTGSRAKQRIHIFWQRRIREDDNRTEYWFPSQTTGGAVAEDRIVLPIPPGMHWRDAKPLVLPELPEREAEEEMPTSLPGGQPVRVRPEQPKLSRHERAAMMRANSAHLGGVPIGKKAVIRGGRIKYVDRTDYVPELDAPDEYAPPKKAKPKRQRRKHDPKYMAAARELRDRYLEQINDERMLPEAIGKYDVSRQLGAAPTNLRQVPGGEPGGKPGGDRLLDAA